AGAAGIVGPTLARAFDRIDVVARTSDTLLVLGESGSGKELAARRFHDASPRAGGPFVAVNCATIPEGIAERRVLGRDRRRRRLPGGGAPGHAVPRRAGRARPRRAAQAAARAGDPRGH